MIHHKREQKLKRMWARVWVWLSVWVCFSPITLTPTLAFATGTPADTTQEVGDVVGALNRIVQALDSHERHTTLYERVSMLEENLNKKTENEMKLESEVVELRAKIPLLEAEIQTIPEMRKDLAEFEAKIEKLVHDYEAKLSTLASEVIRLKKTGARRKDLQTLSDGSDNVLLRIDAPVCPEVGLGMVAERVGDQCLYFSWGTPLNWTAAHRHCQSLGGDLSAPEDLLPLKTFLHGAFARGPSIWLGVSYNLDDEDYSNTTNTKTLLNSTTPGNFSQLNHTEETSEGSSTFDLNRLGSSAVFSNRIDDDSDSDEDSQDMGPNDIGLAQEMPLRDEAIVPSGVLLPEGGSLSQRFLARDSLFGSMSSRVNLRSRLPETSLASFVDFILLQDPDKPDEGIGNPQVDNHPSRVLTLDKRPLTADGRPGANLHTQLMGQQENPNERISPGVFRDVREVVVNETGHHRQDFEEPERRLGESKNTGKAKMKCMLLQQKESLEYELVGKPCNEQHRFVCEIFSSSTNTDIKFSPDNFLHE